MRDRASAHVFLRRDDHPTVSGSPRSGRTMKGISSSGRTAMRYKLTFVAGLATGYVLGTKAGRKRYDTISDGVRRLIDSPAVQETAGVSPAPARPPHRPPRPPHPP